MAQNLAQHFVRLRRHALAAKPLTELAFNHVVSSEMLKAAIPRPKDDGLAAQSSPPSRASYLIS